MFLSIFLNSIGNQNYFKLDLDTILIHIFLVTIFLTLGFLYFQFLFILVFILSTILY